MEWQKYLQKLLLWLVSKTWFSQNKNSYIRELFQSSQSIGIHKFPEKELEVTRPNFSLLPCEKVIRSKLFSFLLKFFIFKWNLWKLLWSIKCINNLFVFLAIVTTLFNTSLHHVCKHFVPSILFLFLIWKFVKPHSSFWWNIPSKNAFRRPAVFTFK